MIAIIDYNCGNLRSVEAACRAVGADAIVTNDPEDLWRCSAAILPGVGAFGPAMQRLRFLGIIDHLKSYASVRPLLGICLGMQLLMEGSEEGEGVEGLGLIRGKCLALPNDKFTIPRVGRQPITATDHASWAGSMLDGTLAQDQFYFCHSYAVAAPADNWLASTPFDDKFYCAAIRHGNVFGVQFHPEKSGAAGLGVFRRLRQMVEGRVAA